MDTRLITDIFLCPDSNLLLERTVLVIATVCVSNYWKRYQTPYVMDTSDQCARGFPCAVFGFGHARVFGLRPTKPLTAREEKPLVPRVPYQVKL